MTRNEFALRVITGHSETYGAGSIFDDLLDFIERLAPILIELFTKCPASRIQRVAKRGRGALYRLSKGKIKYAIYVEDEVIYDAMGDALAQSIIKTCGKCSTQEIEGLMVA